MDWLPPAEGQAGVGLRNGGVGLGGDSRPIARGGFGDVFVAGANGRALLVDVRIVEIRLDQSAADRFRPQGPGAQQSRCETAGQRHATHDPHTVGDDQRPDRNTLEKHRRPVLGRRCPARPTFGRNPTPHRVRS
jgi:hypothetical protein